MYTIIIFFIILLLLFLPIPIYIKLHYYNNNLHIYLYGIEIHFKKRVTKNVKHDIRSKDYIEIIKNFYPIVKDINIKLKDMPLKPSLYFNFYMDFGFKDICKTALYFGILNSLSPFLYIFINKYFHIKKYNFHITPNFKSSKIDLLLKSIFKVSLVNTIFIVILILAGILNGKKNKKIELLHPREEL